ncbi:dihydropteroate synthase [Celeribacter litoreus]|uniref:dihydropteroate synthase n=1 Tax=Celeribacter litoreus TaxID=2876714 RepID=UPI001CCAF8F0|nr:dihydropteroate synthase [Celeribacter litoreus]MCA0045217.1 dihydropteroate synthase [Celeribacter litoreus]
MSEKLYFRPIPCSDPARPETALSLAGGWLWFDSVEVLSRDDAPRIIPVSEVPAEVLTRLTAPRGIVAGLDMARPNLMGILNTTPDSFSDGGQFERPEAALEHALGMVADGADIIDVGGESTRPGAAYVIEDEEIRRTAPVIAAIRNGSSVPISIDTRKARVADQAVAAGATLINDVYAFTHDPKLVAVAKETCARVCLMHAQGDPEVMQENPNYENVLLDVYDFLEERVAFAVAQGIAREKIIVDPGIGFGKTVAHNLSLLERLSLFHALGCPVLLGASRKRFIGTIGQVPDAQDRAPGSIAVALGGIAQGMQITRVHDIKETRQALALWQAVHGEESSYDA